MVGTLAFIGCVVVGLVLGIPEPSVHDEFSYLLAADTFSQGRLTNPTHPMWVHFETFHVIHQPTYMSKYQPAQGLLLALGRVVGGHPIVGAWLGMAFMCAAICWMLHAWVPPRWALLGGIFAIIHPNIGVGSYWAQSYWGGAISAAGGALLLGGTRYLIGKPRALYSLALGAGLAILANSRPYEGLVLSVPLGIGLLIKLCGKSKPPFTVTIRNILLPLTIFGIITVCWMAYYNYRIAGSAFRIPYLVHEETYSLFAYFIWQKPPPAPSYRHTVIRDYHADYELPLYREKQSMAGFLKANLSVWFTYLLFAGSVFLLPLVGSARHMLTWCWRNPRGRLALLTYIFFALGLMLETVMSLHYWAPITGLLYFFVLQAMRLWRARNYRVGQVVLYAVPLLAVAALVINLYQSLWAQSELDPHRQRAKLLAQLKQQEGQHLILVEYGPNHSYDREWIYNQADIDASRVVWAHDMKLAENCRLIDYFKDRRVWSLKIDHDKDPIELAPFPTQACFRDHASLNSPS